MTLIGFVMAVILGKGMKYSLDAEDVKLREMFSVPVQQLGYTYNNYTIDAKNKDIIEFCIPNVASYNPHLSDKLKGTIENDYNVIYFSKIWIKQGLRHPIAYIEADYVF